MSSCISLRMLSVRMSPPVPLRRPAALALAAILLATFAGGVSGQPAHDWEAEPEVHPGLRLARVSVVDPRPTNLYCLRIDLANPRIRFTTTDASAECGAESLETRRATTRDFVRARRREGANVVAAINADWFAPWPAPWNRETCSDLGGLAVSEGVLVSPGSGTPSFVVRDDGSTTLTLTTPATDVADIRTAASGFAFVLEEGVPLAGGDDLHPRTGIGLSRDRRFATWLVIDGRRHAGQGATTEEVGAWLLRFGAWNGINLDGGGSSTLALFDPEAEARTGTNEEPASDGVVLVNRPVGDGRNWMKLPESREADEFAPRERANGNNLGVIVLEEREGP